MERQCGTSFLKGVQLELFSPNCYIDLIDGIMPMRQCSISYLAHNNTRSTDGTSEALNTAHFPQYSQRSVASRAVFRDLGHIEGRGRASGFYYLINIHK